jgi:hypothetical protein
MLLHWDDTTNCRGSYTTGCFLLLHCCFHLLLDSSTAIGDNEMTVVVGSTLPQASLTCLPASLQFYFASLLRAVVLMRVSEYLSIGNM